MNGYVNLVHIKVLHWLTEYRDRNQNTGFSSKSHTSCSEKSSQDYSHFFTAVCSKTAELLHCLLMK
jgi:hypothetical protein